VRPSRQRPRSLSKFIRRKLDGAVNFTASHIPRQYHGLKFSSADARPRAPLKSLKDIETRATQLAAKGGVPALPHGASNPARGEKVNLREDYLKRIEELVDFETLRKAKPSLVVDAPSRLRRRAISTATLTDHGVTVQLLRANAIASSTGRGPTSLKRISAPLRKA